MINEPWYYRKNVIRNINKFVNDKGDSNIWIDVDGVILRSCQGICDMLGKGRGEDVVSLVTKLIIKYHIKRF